VTDIHTLTDLASYAQEQVERLTRMRRLDELAADLERLAARHDLDR
jgi:hypothetical protein